MLRSVQFPMRTLSENAYRRGHWSTHAKTTKQQRALVTMILRSQMSTPPLSVMRGEQCIANAFEVRIVRRAERTLDTDNLLGACKGARDSVAAWLGIDDGASCVVWTYDQEKIRRGTYEVRIEVRDLAHGDDEVKIVGAKARRRSA